MACAYSIFWVQVRIVSSIFRSFSDKNQGWLAHDRRWWSSTNSRLWWNLSLKFKTWSMCLQVVGCSVRRRAADASLKLRLWILNLFISCSGPHSEMPSSPQSRIGCLIRIDTRECSKESIDGENYHTGNRSCRWVNQVIVEPKFGHNCCLVSNRCLPDEVETARHCEQSCDDLPLQSWFYPWEAVTSIRRARLFDDAPPSSRRYKPCRLHEPESRIKLTYTHQKTSSHSRCLHHWAQSWIGMKITNLHYIFVYIHQELVRCRICIQDPRPSDARIPPPEIALPVAIRSLKVHVHVLLVWYKCLNDPRRDHVLRSWSNLPHNIAMGCCMSNCKSLIQKWLSFLELLPQFEALQKTVNLSCTEAGGCNIGDLITFMWR